MTHGATIKRDEPFDRHMRPRVDVQPLQEQTYGPHCDYRAGSPHLVHWQLYDRLVQEVLGTIAAVRARGLPPTVLEVGAGHGGYTEPVLAGGAQVMATEMSRPSLRRLQERFGANPLFSCGFDPDGTLQLLRGQRYSVVLCVSVLHHIPDYMTFVQRAVSDHVAVGGSFVSIQDPLWYPSLPRWTRRLDRAAYLSWRARRGNYRQGARTLTRRLRGRYDEDEPADMVEYHVVRDGVDQDRLRGMLSRSFEHVVIKRYWSTPSASLQRAGTRIGLENTFMVVGTAHSRSVRRTSESIPG